MKPEAALDGFLVDASLLLNYERLATEAYVSVGVPLTSIKRAPFYEWLGPALKCDIEEAAVVQTARDGRLTERLFDYKAPLWEQPALDLAHLFIEAKRSVFIVSHETPDALEAIVARCGLPGSVRRFPLVGPDKRHDLASAILEQDGNTSWLAVYDAGLTRSQERRIIASLAGRGVVVNVDEPTNRSADVALMKVMEDRWLL